MCRRARLKLECLEERVLLNGRTDFVVNTTLAGNQFNPAVAIDGQGNYIVAWEGPDPSTGSEGVFAQRFHADGTPNGGQIVVDSTFIGPQSTPSVAADAAGDFVIVWNGPGPGLNSNALWGEVYDNTGTAVTTNTFLDSFTAGKDSQPRVAMNAAGTSIVVTYTGTATGTAHIYGQMFDGFLDTLRSSFVLNTTQTASQSESALAMDSTGNFVVTWLASASGTNSIVARRFDGQGNALTGEMTVASTNVTANGSVAIAPNGGFLADWNGTDQTTHNSEAVAVSFNASNQPGTPFVVSNPATASLAGSVGFDSAGNSVIGFQVTSSNSIEAQRYNASGNALGAAATLNASPASNQSPVGLAVAPDGTYLAAWAAASTAGDLDVHAALVPPGNPPTVISSLTGTLTGNEGGTFAYQVTATDSDGDPLTYSWDLNGTGVFGGPNSASASAVFTQIGKHQVSVQVSDGQNPPVQASVTVNVINVAPTVNAGPSQTISEGATATFQGSSTDPGSANETYTYAWDFNYDGQTFISQATGANVQHQFSQVGTFTVALQVTDSNGGVSIGTTTVTVTNVAPTVNAGPSQTISEGATANFKGSSNDPGSANETYAYAWDFNYDGQTFISQATGANVQHQFAQVGTFTVALQVTDSNGGVSIGTTTVTVTNVAPSVNAGLAQTISEGATATFQGSSTDPGSANETYAYAWDFNYNGQSFTSQATGANVQHQFSQVGTFTVALQVTDSNGGVTIGTTTVTVTNVAPTVNAGPSQTISEGATATFQGSSNDPGSANETYAYAWDFNYNGQTFNSQATGATAQHQFLQPGTFTVALRVTDSNGAVSIGTTTVTVTNVAPTPSAGPAQTINAGATASFHGTATDPGLPVDVLSYAWDFTYDGKTFVSQATGQNVSHVYPSAGSFQVALQVTDSSGATGLSVTTVTVQATQADPDLAFQSITTPYGDTRVLLNYSIVAPAPLTQSVQVALYATLTGVIDSKAVLLGTTTISTTELDTAGQLALAPGSHTLLRSTSQLGFPTDRGGSRLAHQDYYLAARLDNTMSVNEATMSNNDVVYSGVYQVDHSNKLFIQGIGQGDVVSLVDRERDVKVTFDGSVFQYPERRVEVVDARLHGANSKLDASGTDAWIRAWAGATNDTLIGGRDVNFLHGSGGYDLLVANGIVDFLFGGGGHDRFAPNHGLDVIYGGATDLIWSHDQWVPFKHHG
jgi:PKD repeat protein